MYFSFFYIAKKSTFEYTFYEDNRCVDETNSLSVEIVQAKARHFTEITRYLSQECTSDINNLEQLTFFDVMKNLYIKFNVIMPSESDVERLFSFGGMIMRPHRRHMKSGIFEKTIILKSNCYRQKDGHDEKI